MANVVDVARAGVITVPLTAVLLALEAVKLGRSGLDTTHELIPDVTHPSVDLSPATIAAGFATNISDTRATCTEHCAVPVSPLSVHVRPNVAVLLPARGLGAATVTGLELAAENPPPTAVPDEHEYDTVTGAPTSATLGAHAIDAVGVVLAATVADAAPGTHCHPDMHDPLYVARHAPPVHELLSGCEG